MKNVVFAGEVDAGKSTLIGRFLYEAGAVSNGAMEELKRICEKLDTDFEFAYLLDSFEEERKDKLTIDTTQVACRVKRGENKEFIFIDVPGHQELLRNMLSGSSYADMAVLVIDANDLRGVQTRRHAFILKLLGIKDITVVINKMDTINFEAQAFTEIKANISALFANLGIVFREIIPVSAREGDNLLARSKSMHWYEGPSLLEALNYHTESSRKNYFRLPVQDIYHNDGEDIAVGRIVCGKVSQGDKVAILPSGRESRIKEIKIFGNKKRTAESPESIGLVLNNAAGIERGDIISKPELPRVSRTISANIFCVQPLDLEKKLVFRCSTQEAACRIKGADRVLDSATLEPKEKRGILDKYDIALITLETDSAVATESFAGVNVLGRFVLQLDDQIYAVGMIN